MNFLKIFNFWEKKEPIQSPNKSQQVLDTIIEGRFMALVDDYFEHKPAARELLDAPEVHQMWEAMLTQRGLNRHRFGTLAADAPDERSAFDINIGVQCGIEARLRMIKAGDRAARKKWIQRGASLHDFWCQSQLTKEFEEALTAAIEEHRQLSDEFIDQGVATALEMAKYHYSIGFSYLSAVLWRVAYYYKCAAQELQAEQAVSASTVELCQQLQAKMLRFATCAIAAINVAVEVWPESRNITRNGLFHFDDKELPAAIQAQQTQMHDNKRLFEADMLASSQKSCALMAVSLGKQIAETIKQDGVCRLAQL